MCDLIMTRPLRTLTRAQMMWRMILAGMLGRTVKLDMMTSTTSTTQCTAHQITQHSTTTYSCCLKTHIVIRAVKEPS